ncbi:MAG TPA: S8 family serine peptidase [Gaiellaceae bacterium]|nr:S8 family serine peptidase [Gaiellaceae bacterium]
MSQLNERGARSERGSALWGTGGRGGDRSSVLWGKGGRGAVVLCVLVCALAAPLAATASYQKLAPTWNHGSAPASPTAPATTGSSASVPNASSGSDTTNYVAPQLLSQATSTPAKLINVIIMASGGFSDAQDVEQWIANFDPNHVSDNGDLNLVGGVALSLPADLVTKLQGVQGLTVIPDSPVQLSGGIAPAPTQQAATYPTSSQLWPYVSGNAAMWLGDQFLYSNKLPAIAVVDSGIENRADFGNRIEANVNLSTISGNSDLSDDDGHGTFVAGIAAGNAPGLAGAAPGAPIVSIKVMNSQGQALTSDVIQACQWILDHKAQYNIRVANFSLHSSYSTNFWRDPLDQAVEKLWFNGVTVVAAAGNYGISNTQPSGVLYSPGDDPFVITVGALDLNGTAKSNDDQVAPWSSWGYTPDGFAKPEISAPGRYMVGPIPAGSTITQEKASNMVGANDIQLSGTSFAAPVVSGTVAELLARHPSWTPDQVKGALMKSARQISNVGNPLAAGLGELTVTRAAAAQSVPNGNLGLDRFVKNGLVGTTGLAFDAMSWVSAVQSDMSWNSMSWADQSWSDMSWADQSWSDMSWADQSWSDMSWTDMSWADMSWADMSQEDAALGDSIDGSDGYVATPDQFDAAVSDPDQVQVDDLPADVTALVTPTATDPTTCDPTTDSSDGSASSDGSEASCDPAATTDPTDGSATTGDGSTSADPSDGSTSSDPSGSSDPSDGTTSDDPSDTSSSSDGSTGDGGSSDSGDSSGS